MMYWFLDPIANHYADFKGRASRKQYWMFALGNGILMLGILVSMVYALFNSSTSFDFGGLTGFIVLLCIVALALFLPTLAIQVRRLHDIGWSGWWILVSFIPYIGGLVLVVLYCLPSQVGTNKYGVHPYGAESVAQSTVATSAIETNTPPQAA